MMTYEKIFKSFFVAQEDLLHRADKKSLAEPPRPGQDDGAELFADKLLNQLSLVHIDFSAVNQGDKFLNPNFQFWHFVYHKFCEPSWNCLWVGPMQFDLNRLKSILKKRKVSLIKRIN
jgi:hypothetical protein